MRAGLPPGIATVVPVRAVGGRFYTSSDSRGCALRLIEHAARIYGSGMKKAPAVASRRLHFKWSMRSEDQNLRSTDTNQVRGVPGTPVTSPREVVMSLFDMK